MSERLFTPLKMTHTTARQPPEPALIGGRSRRLRVGWSAYQRVAVPLHAEPSGRRGEHDGRRHGPVHAGGARRWLVRRSAGAVAGVARGAAAAAVSRPSAAARRHLRLPPVGHARPPAPAPRRHARRSGGRMLLDPSNGFGLFVASNANPGIGNHLLEPVLTHLYGPTPTPAPRRVRGSRARRTPVAGVYLDTHRTRHDLSRIRALMPMLQSRVTADDGGRHHVGRPPLDRGGAVHLSGIERRRHTRLPADGGTLAA